MKKKLLPVLMAVLFAVSSNSAWLNTILKPLGITDMDTIAHASSGGGSITPPRPSENVDDPVERVSYEDKKLPLTDDFVTNVKYNNDFGYAIFEINPNRLSNGFVNNIEYIGINENKYTYRTVNKDKSNWYRIFIPYKYLPEDGSATDFYFYLSGKTYHYKWKPNSNYERNKKLVPNIVPLETTAGTNKTIQFKVSYQDGYDIDSWYDEISKDSLQIISIFTFGNQRTDETRQIESVDIDRNEDIISVKLKENYQLYKFYVHEFTFRAENYINGYSYLILYDEPPQLKGTWATDGDYSYTLTDLYNGVYLGELSSVKLTNLSTNEEKELDNENYMSTWSTLTIPAKEFESNTRYKITLEHSSVATKSFEITTPNIPEIQEVDYIDINDIDYNKDLTFTVNNNTWLKKVNAISVFVRGREIPLNNEQFSVDLEKNQITILNSVFEETGKNWSILIPVKGYHDATGEFFVHSQQGPFTNTYAPSLEGRWAENGNFIISDPKEKYSSFISSNYKVNLLNKESEKSRLLFKDTRRETKDYRNKYEIELNRDYFEPNTSYQIRVFSRDYGSGIVEVPPRNNDEIKSAEANIPSFLHDTDLVIHSDNIEWLDNIKSITIKDERLFSNELTSDHWIKKENQIVIPYEVYKKNLARPIGNINVKINATGFETVDLDTVCLQDPPQIKTTTNDDFANLSFRSKDDMLIYGYGDYIDQVILNNAILPTSDYTSDAFNTNIRIENRYLVDGENTVTIKNNKYGESSVTFNYDNSVLRNRKLSLLEKINSSNLSSTQKSEYTANTNKATTLSQIVDLELRLEDEQPTPEVSDISFEITNSNQTITSGNQIVEMNILTNVISPSITSDNLPVGLSIENNKILGNITVSDWKENEVSKTFVSTILLRDDNGNQKTHDISIVVNRVENPSLLKIHTIYSKGASLSGMMSNNAYLIFNKIDPITAHKTLKELASNYKDKEITDSFDISVIGQYSGKLVLSVPVSTKDSNVTVIHLGKNGIETFDNVSVVNNKISLEVNDLSPFIVLSSKSTVKEVVEDNKTLNQENSKNSQNNQNSNKISDKANIKTSSVDTSDDRNVLLLAFILLLSVATLITTIKMKKR